MLSKKNRLPLSPQKPFEGQRLFHPQFTIVVNTNQLGYSRIATIITKRQLSLAVDRNHQRRRLLHAFRQLIDLNNSIDLLFIPKASFFSLNPNQLIYTVNTFFNSQPTLKPLLKKINKA